MHWLKDVVVLTVLALVATMLIWDSDVSGAPVVTPCFKDPPPAKKCPAVPTTQCDGSGTTPAAGCAGGGIFTNPTCTGGNLYTGVVPVPPPDFGPCKQLPNGGNVGNTLCVTDASRGSPTITCYTYQNCTGGPCSRLTAASPWTCDGPPAGAPVQNYSYLGARNIGTPCQTPAG